MGKKIRLALAGGLAGAVNGIFGGGGGMVLLPLLTRWGGVTGRSAFATCVAAIFPMCAVSAAACLMQGKVDWGRALPYLAGGAVGGAVGGLTFGRVPVGLLRVLFALFLLYGGVRYLL